MKHINTKMGKMAYRTRISWGVVMIVMFGLFPSTLFAATFNLSTDKTQFHIGDEFSVDIKVESDDTGVNAAQATLQFPKDILQASNVDKANSVFDFWLQGPSTDNSTGRISFIGGSVSGVSGKTLQILRINFKVVGAGQANIGFTDGAITASDGSGTNVLALMNGLTVTSVSKKGATVIVPPPPTVPPPKIIVRPAVPSGKLPEKPNLRVSFYSDTKTWYNTVGNFLVSWPLPNDVTDIATVVNKEPTSDLTKSEGLFDNKTFPALSDGLWYLHVRFKNNVGWGPTADFKIGVDTAPPLAFQINSPEGFDTPVITPTISYATHDQPSGIARYHIVIDGKEATSTLLTTYTLPPLDSGDHNLVVIAEDFAGNKTSTRVKLHIQEHAFFVIGRFHVTQFWFFTTIFLLVLAGFASGWVSYRLWRERMWRKIVIAQRDVKNLFTTMDKDLEKIIRTFKDGVTESEAAEASFRLEDMRKNLEKAQKYIVENINEISE